MIRNWAYHLQQNLKLDTALQSCKCIPYCRRQRKNKCEKLCFCSKSCFCEEEDYANWQNDFLYRQKFTPPPVLPVNKNNCIVLDIKGQIQGPYLYEQWLNYSFFCLDYFDDIISHNKNPDWSQLYFRAENYFYAGIYSHFSQIFLIFINQLEGDTTKHHTYNDVHAGVDLFENLQPISQKNKVPFRNTNMPERLHKFMSTRTKIHRLNANHIHRENTADWDILKLRQMTKNKLDKIALLRKESALTKDQFVHDNTTPDFEIWYPKTREVPVLHDAQKKIHKVIIRENSAQLDPFEHDLLLTFNKWITTGSIIFTPRSAPSELIPPLILANAIPEWGKKQRICYDSGYIKAVEAQSTPCKLEGLVDVLQMLKKGDRLNKCDDCRGFHLLKINSESRKIAGLRFQNQDFSYRCLPFGIPKAPGAFQRANMAAINFCRKFGIRSSLYLDDRLFAEDAGQDEPRNTFLGLLTIIAAGGVLALDKSTFSPQTKLEFLGLEIDTQKTTIQVPAEEYRIFCQMAQICLSEEKMTRKFLERLRGKAVSFGLANQKMKLYIREMTTALTNANSHPETIIQLTPELKAEIEKWLNLDHFSLIHNWSEKEHTNLSSIIFTDASQAAQGIVIFDSCQTRINSLAYTEAQSGLPIHWKEAIAIKNAVTYNPQAFRNKNVTFFCDNMSVVWAFKQLGCSNPYLNKIVRETFELLADLDSKFTVVWISTLFQVADRPSRRILWNEEFIPMKIFQRIQQKIGVRFEIDLMATPQNAKCERFISWCQTPTSWHTNLFTIKPAKLQGYTCYCFPPKNLLAQTLTFVKNNLMHTKIVIIFHVWAEWPLSVTTFQRQKNVRFVKLHPNWLNFPALSLIPSEKKVEIYDQSFCASFNTRPAALYAMLFNLE